ncbi:MAG: hypothetical protein CMJ85_13740 [Planctomycetes bacterium]|jgi:Ca2+-binding EF-hand superfamily protein|nr:hypothetical protein [Planctomycetota bacterium]
MKAFVVAAAVAALFAPESEAQGFGRRGGGGQGRVWEFLAKKYDKNKDGKIAVAEYDRGEAKFRTYDKDGDGILTKADFEGAGGRGGGRRQMRPEQMLPRLARRADKDQSGDVTGKEWAAFVEQHAGGDLESLFGTGRTAQRMMRMLGSLVDTSDDGEVQKDELAALFAKLDKNKDGSLGRNEMGRNQRGGQQTQRVPQRGEVAPDFDLPLVESVKQTLRLSNFRGKRPVALIFGSYT